MLSESARVLTAAESRFRISAPNSSQRSVKVVALDQPSEQIVLRLADQAWGSAVFLTAAAFGARSALDSDLHATAWLTDLAGRSQDLIDEVTKADLLVMIATVGHDSPAAAIIGEVCAVSGVMTTALVVAPPDEVSGARARTLAKLRPHAKMVVATSTTDYVADMLAALRA